MNTGFERGNDEDSCNFYQDKQRKGLDVLLEKRSTHSSAVVDQHVHHKGKRHHDQGKVDLWVDSKLISSR
jgi:hypothetical protein